EAPPDLFQPARARHRIVVEERDHVAPRRFDPFAQRRDDSRRVDRDRPMADRVPRGPTSKELTRLLVVDAVYDKNLVGTRLLSRNTLQALLEPRDPPVSRDEHGHARRRLRIERRRSHPARPPSSPPNPLIPSLC